MLQLAGSLALDNDLSLADLVLAPMLWNPTLAGRCKALLPGYLPLSQLLALVADRDSFCETVEAIPLLGPPG
jgi:glutathione S-transferase